MAQRPTSLNTLSTWGDENCLDILIVSFLKLMYQPENSDHIPYVKLIRMKRIRTVLQFPISAVEGNAFHVTGCIGALTPWSVY